MIAKGKTNVGMLRPNNEDSIFVSMEPVGPLQNLFIVADGMGGHKAGEVASARSIEFFVEHVKSEQAGRDETLDLLISGINYANNKVYEMTTSHFEYEGMGTTFTACTISENKVLAGHIGDSRLYIIDGNKIEQVSSDHSYVAELLSAGKITAEEADIHPNKNLLTKALGVTNDAEGDGIIAPLTQTSYVLMCTDGLTNMLTNDEIRKVVAGVGTVESKVDRLIAAANQNGGVDNITVILISMGNEVKL